MSLTKSFIIGAMTADIARVEREFWTGSRDKVCDPTTQKKLKETHEANVDQLAEECRARYIATARRRLARYQQTGEIGEGRT